MLHCMSCGKSWYEILLGISEDGVQRMQLNSTCQEKK